MRIPFIYGESQRERYQRRLRDLQRRYQRTQREHERQTFAASDGVYIVDPATSVLTRIA